MEEQTLRYYLVLFNLLITIILILYFSTYKNLKLDSDIIEIKKGSSISEIVENITINENFFIKKIFRLNLIIANYFSKPSHYGKFKINKNTSIKEIINIISKKSNIDYKITIVNGWQTYQLRDYLLKYYKYNKDLSYYDLIADTYIINSSNSFEDLKKYLSLNKDNFFKKYKNNKILNDFGIKKVMIISSLIEREAKDNSDKGLIASVIFNRLKSNMRLQIDASVIASITEGEYLFERKLTYDDLKIDHPLNTYKYKGLPKKMVSYAGYDTLKIVLKSPKSDFLFYFYNILEKKHIFSKNYNEHKKKLNEYRSKKK